MSRPLRAAFAARARTLRAVASLGRSTPPTDAPACDPGTTAVPARRRVWRRGVVRTKGENTWCAFISWVAQVPERRREQRARLIHRAFESHDSLGLA
mmetsp:Transcript_12954/g.54370  ORF Transcript_12954/g.54370 Transcript_12954/m.54370 type:complete len:97 (+) Transcript_12954:1984-2274(+)